MAQTDLINEGLLGAYHDELMKTEITPRPTKQNLENGIIVPALAENLASWEGQTNAVDDVQSNRVFTTGGDESIDSSVDAVFSQIVATSDANPAKVMTSGKNLLRLESNNGWAKAVGTGWYIMVPALPYGEIGKAVQPNGLLLCTDSGETKTVNGFTYERGENLKTATVRFKKLSDGVPTGVNDGTACAYTDASDAQGNTYRFYNCTEPGYIIISGITFAQTCARIAWSGGASYPYDMFVSPTDANDAGSSIDLSTALAACQPGGKLLAVGGEGDQINRESGTALRWIRINSRVQPTWTNTLQDDGVTYLHEATISDMKADGKAEFETENVSLTVNGTTVSYSDTNAIATTDYVKYQLATQATGTVSVASTSVGVEDYGLMAVYGGTGDVKSVFIYGQGMPDTLRAMATVKIFTLRDEVTALSAQMGQQTAYEEPVVEDMDYMPMLGGQPGTLFCAGAPTQSNKPANWIDCVDGGYEWTGLPNVVGQHVRDITNGTDYYGWLNPDTNLLEWK